MVKVSGSGKNKRAEVKSLIEFCVDKLMPRLKDKLAIDVTLIANLTEKEGLAGDCIWNDDSCNRPREFIIRVDSTQDRDDMMETVAHEMVHVKQYARGELKDFSATDAVCKWQGKDINLSKLNYYDHPWEIEAHGREKGLYIQWVSSEI
jgi:hypothetical protein